MGDLASLFVDQSRPLAEKPTIKQLNHSHEAIARWMLENPEGRLKECADHFGYTQSWLSIIIHSDAFEMHYRQLQQQADALVINDIPAKMRGVASMALEGLGDQVEAALLDKTTAPRQFLLQTSEALLSKLGYGGKNGSVNVNVAPGGQATVGIGTADPVAIERARTRLMQSRANEAEVVEGTVVGNDDTKPTT